MNAAPQSSAWRAWLLVVAAMWTAFAPAWAASASAVASPPFSPTAYQADGYESAREVSRACARGQNSHLGFLAENARFDASRTSATTETASGSEAAAAKTASGVCIYLYAHSDPVNGIDPSGMFNLPEMLSTTWSGMKIAGGKAFAAYQVYDKADTFASAASLIGAFATGQPVTIMQLTALGIDFLPFGKVLKRMEDIGQFTVKGEQLLRQVYKLTGRAEALGDMGAQMAIRMKKFKSVGFKAEYHGIDDIVEDGVGNLIIVEAKGGASKLATSAAGGQMSRKWIESRIQRLYASGQGALAKRLQDQADAGRLKGMVVTTRADGSNAFTPNIKIKDWAQIGASTW